jgi:hypothetical protein
MRNGMPLNEESIRRILMQVVDNLHAGLLDHAEMKLDSLAFERLSSHKWNEAVDRTAESGCVKRVGETGMHIATCERSLRKRDAAAALFEAQRALARWTTTK